MLTIQTENSLDQNIIPILVKGNTVCHLGSLYNNQLFAKNWLDFQLGGQAEYMIILGGGSGHIVEEALERIPGEILVVEPELEIYTQMRQSDTYKKLHYTTRVTWAYGNNVWEIVNQWVRRILNEDNVEITFLTCHPGYREVFVEQWNQLDAICEKVCSEIAFMKAPIKRFIAAMIENQIRNVIRMKDGVLIGRCKRVWNNRIPVIMVSAGPSLEKNIAELHRVNHNALIVAVDAAVPTLLSEGIVPDLIGCTDAMKCLDCFEDDRCKSVPILVTTNTPTRLLDMHNGVRLWGYDHPFVRELFEKLKLPSPEVPFYSGVATALFSSLIELGAETIVLVGQDLAYSEDGKSHVTGRDEGFVKDENYKLEGYYGGMVYSRGDWTLFHDWFERMVQAFPKHKIINATEGGAKIKGTIQKKLSEVVDELRQIELKEDIFDCSFSALKEEEYNVLLENLKECRDYIDSLSETSYYDAFYLDDWRKRPAMHLIIDYMKSLDFEKREERYREAVSYVKQVWERYEDELEEV